MLGFGFFGLWNLSKWIVGFGNQPLVTSCYILLYHVTFLCNFVYSSLTSHHPLFSHLLSISLYLPRSLYRANRSLALSLNLWHFHK